VGYIYYPYFRAIGPVHNHTNDFGDIQTAPAKHDGLTPLGAEAVREMNNQGILIDAAHASEPTRRQEAKKIK
jgi:membrane dipeptidase